MSTGDKENTSKPAAAGSYQQPFVEKYRPKSLEDVEGNEETILRLRAIGKDGNMPNLILAGPPGTGSEYHKDMKDITIYDLREY
jgi:replication factor C subunit 2/4